jgi:hypothetical protein
MRKMAEKETNRNEDNLFLMGSSIGWGPRLMKRMSLVRISLPFLCGHVKKKKNEEDSPLHALQFFNVPLCMTHPFFFPLRNN